ncbi:MAG: ATP-binding protein [Alistipes sp.]
MKKVFEIINQIDEIERVAAFIEELGEELNLSPSLVMNINLAIEEAIVNIIQYAYPVGSTNTISLSAEHKDNELIFILTDRGAAFDPTEIPEADISLALEERPIGGLGIFLVRKIMGEVTYQRIDGKNQLEMRKKISQ